MTPAGYLRACLAATWRGGLQESLCTTTDYVAYFRVIRGRLVLRSFPFPVSLAPQPQKSGFMNGPFHHRGFVTTSLGQLHYRACGEGPPIVLMQTLPFSTAMFTNLMGVLGQHYAC